MEPMDKSYFRSGFKPLAPGADWETSSADMQATLIETQDKLIAQQKIIIDLQDQTIARLRLELRIWQGMGVAE